MATVLEKLLVELDEVEQDVHEFSLRVAPVYKALNWEWSLDNGLYVPNKDDIKKVAYSLIRDVRRMLLKRLNSKKPVNGYFNWFAATGGIRVQAVHYSCGEYEVTMKMEIEV